MKLLTLALLFAGAPAFAASSACVIYMANDGSGATVQQSCDGADLSDLFTATGITAGMSKAIPMFLGKGYTFSGCTDSFSDGTDNQAGTAYSRCVFIKN
jgi:hypothetical protein